MRIYILLFLSCCLCACAGSVYSTAKYTPFAVYEENRVDIVLPLSEVQPQIALYKPTLYYTRPNSILFINSSHFVDDFEEDEVTLDVSGYDPLIAYNRSMYAFNSAVYQTVFAPFVKTYLFITPKEVRKGVHNVLSNVLAPLRVVLNILMGDVHNAGVEFSKFIINSTAGLLGFLDITQENTPASYRKVNLDDVLHTWGIPAGPFVVLPLIGGRTLRGAIAIPIETFMDPLRYVIPVSTLFASFTSIRIVSSGSQYFDMFYMLEKTSVDPYIAQREIFWQYIQQRHAIR